MKFVAAIEDPKVIRKNLEHMGLDAKPPLLASVRGSPKHESQFADDLVQRYFDDFQ